MIFLYKYASLFNRQTSQEAVDCLGQIDIGCKIFTSDTIRETFRKFIECKKILSSSAFFCLILLQTIKSKLSCYPSEKCF